MRPTRNLCAKFSFAVALAALLAARAPAQEVSAEAAAPADMQETEVDEEVVVRGRRLSELEFDIRAYIRDFLDEVTAPARGRGYARWHRSVCIGVHNLENQAAQYIVDRVSAVALELGLEPGEPGCRPQVNIVFATDARQMAAAMVENDKRAFKPVAGESGMDLGEAALNEFISSDRPVRWWHVSLPIAAHNGAPAIELPQNPCFTPPRCYPTIPVNGPSRVHSGVRDDLMSVVIIVDVNRLTGTTWEQIADYLAVVSLAQIDPTTDPREFDSILNLFSNSAAYSGLTDWDWNYLHALYTFNQERVTRMQGNEIVSKIAKREMSTDD